MATFDELKDKATAELIVALKKRHPSMTDGRAEKRAQDGMEHALKTARSPAVAGTPVEVSHETLMDRTMFIFTTIGVSVNTSAELSEQIIKEVRG